MIGQTWREFVLQADQPRVEQAMRERVAVDVRLEGADGKERVCSVAAPCVTSSGGEP